MTSFVSNDTACKLRVTCRNNDTQELIPLSGVTPRLRWIDALGVEQERVMSIVNVSGVCEYQFLDGELVAPMMSFEVELEDSLGKKMTCLDVINEIVRQEIG